jgi:CheY-like chemotaxis protein
MSLERETVLVIEDNPDDTTLLERTFERFNLAKALQIVPSGESAIAYLDGRDQFGNREEYPLPTLIFLDLKLTGLSGFEVLTWIRQHPRLARIQIVVLTGSRKSLDVYRAFELGASSYLVKPINPEEIARLAESLNLPWLALAEPVRPAPQPASSANGGSAPAT